MTEHGKARPRLYDESSSSHHTINGDKNSAIAAGFVAINVSTTFVSPDRNKGKKLAPGELYVSVHQQPKASKSVLDKLRELPRRSNPDERGYDALGVVLIGCKNDGSEVTLETSFSDGTQVDHILTYASLIQRIGNIYSTRFAAL